MADDVTIEGIEYRATERRAGDPLVPHSIVGSEALLWREDFGVDAADKTAVANALNALWESSFPASASADITNSVFSLNLGTTANAESWIRSRKLLRVPMRVWIAFSINQRVINQDIYFEIIDDTGAVFARVEFDGTNATQFKVQHQNGGVAEGPGMLDTGLISCSSTATLGIVELDLGADEFNVRNRAIDSQTTATDRAGRNRRLPDTERGYRIRIRGKNGATAPVGNTIISIDSIVVQDLNEIMVELAGRGSTVANQGIPVHHAGGLAASNNAIGLVTPKAYWQDDTSTALVANAVFTGVSRDVIGANANANAINSPRAVRCLAVADQAGTLYAEVSRDGTTWRRVEVAATQLVEPGGLHVARIEHLPATKFLRFVFVNGATPQTQFLLQTMQLA